MTNEHELNHPSTLLGVLHDAAKNALRGVGNTRVLYGIPLIKWENLWKLFKTAIVRKGKKMTTLHEIIASYVLGAFAKFRKATKTSSRLSVCPHEQLASHSTDPHVI